MEILTPCRSEKPENIEAKMEWMITSWTPTTPPIFVDSVWVPQCVTASQDHSTRLILTPIKSVCTTSNISNHQQHWSYLAVFQKYIDILPPKLSLFWISLNFWQNLTRQKLESRGYLSVNINELKLHHYDATAVHKAQMERQNILMITYTSVA